MQAMSCLQRSPKILMIDPYEGKASKDTITFNFIDVEKKIIIDSLNMLNSTAKCFLQAVNFSDRVFLIQREHLSPGKIQKVSVYEYHREIG